MSLPLTVKGLRVSAPQGRVLLDVPDLHVAPGQCVGVTGASGAGKSTLLFALAGLTRVAPGMIRWGDIDLGALDRHARARFRLRYLGMVFQDFLLFDELGATGNAAISTLFRPRADRPAIRARARSALSQMAVNDTERAVASLSGGERQRVAVARARAGGADILLADEPTASLHRDAADGLADDLLRDLRAEGRILIAVSHDDALLGRLDRIIRLDHGAVCDG